MGTILYFDCFSGASGDMILGACLDAGLPLDELRRALGGLAIAGYGIRAERVLRQGVGATKFRLHEDGADLHWRQHPSEHHDQHDHDGHKHSHHHDHEHNEVQAHAHSHDQDHHHDHEHGHHHDHPHGHQRHPPHRTVNEIDALIAQSSLSAAAITRARRLFRRLAETEASIHRMPVEEVHLHEVGALDSIVDIVGAVFAMEWFGATRVIASPLNVGGGTVRAAHGVLPVPAPATARLLEGAPVYSNGIEAELVTPTGALLITDYASAYGPLPRMTIRRTGYGAGDRELTGTPNVLRLFVGDEEPDRAAAPASTEQVLLIECEIDDMNPQIFGVVMEQLLAAGALDVLYAPIQMKKNRPGTLVTIVGRPAHRERLSGIMFRETTTLGLRYQIVERERLERETIAVQTAAGTVRVKIARREGHVINAAPEFDDCARLAAERGMSVKDVLALATKAYLDKASS